MVFYRKYRPQFFFQVLDQEQIKRTLQNALSLKRISHAYLFAGPHGTGKTTAARLLAKGINCLKFEKGESCNKCENCQEIIQGKAIDLIEIDGASNRGINEIKNLKENIKTVPFKLKFKVFIIDEVHMLTSEAFNALLKILEEPPLHVIFIFATTSAWKIPLTIISRCQRFDFKKIDSDLIAGKILEISRKEKIQIDQEAVNLISQKADGSIRDAESILNVFFSAGYKKINYDLVGSFLGKSHREKIWQMTNLILRKEVEQALELIDNLVEEGFNLDEFFKDQVEFFRKILLFKIENKIRKEITKEEQKEISDLAAKFEEKELLSLIDLFLKEKEFSKEAPVAQLPLELAVIKSREIIKNQN